MIGFHPRWRCVVLVGAATLLALGCGSADSTTGPPGTPGAKEALTDLVSLLDHLKTENKSPPAQIQDIEPVEPLFQASYVALVRGDIVYVWGTTINQSSPEKILAYEKAVESGSGWVLMQDGSLKTMEASEFQAAPKAAK
jgi:hypothetical protein